MSALGALDLIPALFSRKTQGTGAFGTITEDIKFIVLVLTFGLSGCVEGEKPFERADNI